MFQRCPGAIGIPCQVTDLAFLGQELGVLFGVGLDLGLARLEQALGFYELVLLGEEPREGAAEGACRSRKSLVTDGDGLSPGAFCIVQAL